MDIFYLAQSKGGSLIMGFENGSISANHEMHANALFNVYMYLNVIFSILLIRMLFSFRFQTFQNIKTLSLASFRRQLKYIII